MQSFGGPFRYNAFQKQNKELVRLILLQVGRISLTMYNPAFP